MPTIAQRFESVCQAQPELPAVKSGNRALTYGELNALSNQLARRILEVCGERNGTVALLLEHGVALSVGALACLKANKIYVPLDLNNPVERQKFILDDARADLVLSDGAANSCLPDRVCINVNEVPSDLPATNLKLEPREDDYAFLLYTSGSTGKPKGVINQNKTVVARTADHNRFEVGPGDRLTALGPGGMNLFRALLTGATLVAFDLKTIEIDGLAKWLSDEEITIYHSVPTVFRHFVATLSGKEAFPDLRIVNITGETLLGSDVAAFRRHFPDHCILVNGLGTTETGTFCEMRIDHATPVPVGIVPVGHAIEGTKVVLVDGEERKSSDDRSGEITVYSDDMSPGYWNRPESTAQRFFELADGDRRRAYRTGDLGQWQPDGSLLHLGRIDSQVKIRGNRVETVEIELALLSHPAVKQAAVVGERSDDGATQRLLAYIALGPACEACGEQMKIFLRDRVPEYMVPSQFLFLSQLPETPNGKIDRKALPRPDAGKSVQVEAPGDPASATASELMVIWRDVFGKDEIHVNDNFFELGGDSISALRILWRIHEAFQVELSTKNVYENPSIAGIAKLVLKTEPARRGPQDKSSLRPLPRHPVNR